MNRAEILEIAKPILFNTDMVRATLEDRNSVTRRLLKPQPILEYGLWVANGSGWSDGISSLRLIPGYSLYNRSPYKPGDYLYVRETWTNLNTLSCPCYYYKASDTLPEWALSSWKPSIHMPKEAARIFLRVKDVRVERLQNITEEQAAKEGCINNIGFIHSPDNEYDRIHTAREHFITIWDSTVPKKELDRYGWNANPWVWVIQFERVEV